MSHTITIRKVLPASCEEVFDAWLDAEGMQEWMQPGPVTHCKVALEPRVGGQLQIVMGTPDAEYVSTGEFRVLERPTKLMFTWISSRWDMQETLVTLELKPHGNDCELILTHERFPSDLLVSGVQNGWGHILEKLDTYLV